MRKIDTWLDIQRFLIGAQNSPMIPRESSEFKMVGLSELADVRVRRRLFTKAI